MSIFDNDSTLSGPFEPPTGSLSAPVVPALTILWHPDLNRVGEVALLEDDGVLGFSRDAPAFFVPGSNVGRPIAHRMMGRDPVVGFASAQGRLEIRPGSTDIEVRVDGERFDQARQLDPAELGRGIIVTVARAFAFCLHSIRHPVTRSPNLGLVGSSDAIDDVRHAITRAAGRAEHGPHTGRKRHGQRAGRPRFARERPSRERSFRPRERQPLSAGTRRRRALRPRTRSVHGRYRQSAWPFPRCPRRHPLHRRDRRSAFGGSADAPAGD